MTEEQFQQQAEAECQRLGLLWHHCVRPYRHCRGPKGFPDLAALGNNGWLLAELKSGDGETSAHQDRWIWTASVSGGLQILTYRPAGRDMLFDALRQIA